MPLSDKDTGVVNGLGHTGLEDNSLETALEEILNSQSKNVVELVLGLIKKPILVHPPQKSFTLKDPTRVLLVESEKLSGSVTDTAKRVLNPPQLSLTTKTVFSDKLQLGVKTLLLVRTSRLLEGLAVWLRWEFSNACTEHDDRNLRFRGV